MTHALSAAVDERLTRARSEVAHRVDEAALALAFPVPREVAVAASAVGLLDRYGIDFNGLAYVAAEALTQLAEARPVEPVMPPAASEIRNAAEFPDNQPLGGRGA